MTFNSNLKEYRKSSKRIYSKFRFELAEWTDDKK